MQLIASKYTARCEGRSGEKESKRGFKEMWGTDNSEDD